METQWWAWAAAALILAIGEVILPGFILLGFAIGAASVALALALGWQAGLVWLLLLWAVVSALSWLALRRVVGVRGGQSKTFDRDINEN